MRALRTPVWILSLVFVTFSISQAKTNYAYVANWSSSSCPELNQPQGVAVDSLGNVFIADSNNGVIRKVNTSGVISTFATNANFFYLLQMATDSANNVYLVDNAACVIWKITQSGTISIAAGG